MEMTDRPCPVCGSKDDSKVFAEANLDFKKLDKFAFASRKTPEYMHHRLVVCPTCDLLYANPAPSPKALVSSYQKAAFGSQSEAHYAARTYSRFLPTIIKKIPNQEGALDIGTGDGAFLERLLERGFTQVAGVEPSKAPIESSKKEIRPLIKEGAFNSRDFKKNSMSLVTCFQTLEHLYEPMEICEDARKILKEGGAFYAVFHNRDSLSAKLLGKKSPIFDLEHMQLFSARSAEFLLKKAGFDRIETKIIFNLYPFYYWVKLFPIFKGLKTILVDVLKKIGVGYIPFPLPAGNMAIVGYKVEKS